MFGIGKTYCHNNMPNKNGINKISAGCFLSMLKIIKQRFAKQIYKE
jgi:hypothetical protein